MVDSLRPTISGAGITSAYKPSSVTTQVAPINDKESQREASSQEDRRQHEQDRRKKPKHVDPKFDTRNSEGRRDSDGYTFSIETEA